MRRQHQPEWMDAPQVDRGELERSLRFIQRINRFLGYTRATLSHLDRLSQNWSKSETISIVDLATGSADIPLAILKWADRKGFSVRIVGVDRHPVTAEIARKAATDPRLTIVQADVLDLPFNANLFDYAITNMFLHHLSDDDALRALAAMNRIARRGVVVADLLRARGALAWITLFTLASNKMLKHDARVSLKQAFNEREILSLRDRAGLGYATFHRHFGYRFVLAGEKISPFVI